MSPRQSKLLILHRVLEKQGVEGLADFQRLQWVGFLCRVLLLIRLLWIGWLSEVMFTEMSLTLFGWLSEWGPDSSWLAKACSLKCVFVDHLNSFKTGSDGYLLLLIMAITFSKCVGSSEFSPLCHAVLCSFQASGNGFFLLLALGCFITKDSMNYVHSPLLSVQSVSWRNPDTHLFVLLALLECMLHESKDFSPGFVPWCIQVPGTLYGIKSCSINTSCLLNGLVLQFLSDISWYLPIHAPYLSITF